MGLFTGPLQQSGLCQCNPLTISLLTMPYERSRARLFWVLICTTVGVLVYFFLLDFSMQVIGRFDRVILIFSINLVILVYRTT